MSQSLTGAVQADAVDARTRKVYVLTPEQRDRYHRTRNANRNARRERVRSERALTPCEWCGDPIGIVTTRTRRCADCRFAYENYRPHDETTHRMPARLLLAMRWLDWALARDVFEVAGVDANTDSTEWNLASVSIARLVKRGLVERRVPRRRLLWADYRLTEAGKREADKLRNARAA